MNDYQMTKLSQGHSADLVAEADRDRLARTAGGDSRDAGGWIRRALAWTAHRFSDSESWAVAEWARGTHRTDSLGRDRLSR